MTESEFRLEFEKLKLTLYKKLNLINDDYSEIELITPIICEHPLVEKIKKLEEDCLYHHLFTGKYFINKNQLDFLYNQIHNI